MSTRRKFECLKDLICKMAMLDLPEDVQAFRKRVEDEFAPLINGDAIAPVWMIGDVHDTAKQMSEDSDESPLTDEEAREILATVDRRHDASIGINWDVLGTHVGEKLHEKRRQARLKADIAALEQMAKQLKEQYPHLNVSFGYIGNCGMGADDYDDRSWRFFYNPEVGAPCKSFGGYGTDRLDSFHDYMVKGGGLAVFGGILSGIPVITTGWTCKGSMALGTGCGKCIRCQDELHQDGAGGQTSH